MQNEQRKTQFLSQLDQLAQRRQQLQTQSQTSTTEGNDQGFWGDVADAMQAGIAQGFAGDFETANQIFDSETFAGLRDQALKLEQDQYSQMSEQGRSALGQQLFKQDERGNILFDDGASNWRTWALTAAQLAGQLVPFAATGGPASGVAKMGIKQGAKVIGKQITEEALKRGMPARAANFIGSSAGTIAMANGMASNNVAKKIEEFSIEDLQSQSEEFNQLFNEIRALPENQAFSDQEVGEAAKAELVNMAREKAWSDPKLFAINTLSGAAGWFGGRGVLASAESRFANTLKGASVEGIQEGAQGAVEQRVNNEVVQQLADPTQDLNEGVALAFANEGVLSAGMGGISGALEKPSAKQRAEAQPITGNVSLDTELHSADDIAQTASTQADEMLNTIMPQPVNVPEVQPVDIQPQPVAQPVTQPEPAAPIVSEDDIQLFTPPGLNIEQDIADKYGLPRDYQPTAAAMQMREQQGIALRDDLERQSVRPQGQPITPSQVTDAAMDVRDRLLQQEREQSGFASQNLPENISPNADQQGIQQTESVSAMEMGQDVPLTPEQKQIEQAKSAITELIKNNPNPPLRQIREAYRKSGFTAKQLQETLAKQETPMSVSQFETQALAEARSNIAKPELTEQTNNSLPTETVDNSNVVNFPEQNQNYDPDEMLNLYQRALIADPQKVDSISERFQRGDMSAEKEIEALAQTIPEITPEGLQKARDAISQFEQGDDQATQRRKVLSTMLDMKPTKKAKQKKPKQKQTMFSQEGTKPSTSEKGLTEKAANYYVKEWLKRYNGGAAVTVQVIPTQQEALKYVSGDVPEGATINAFYNEDERKVFIVAENITSPKDLRQKLRHEILAHHAFRQVVGDTEYQAILETVFRGSNSPYLKDILDSVEERYGTMSLNIQVEEIIAMAAEVERSKIQRWLDAVITAIAKALRKVGLMSEGDMTKAELYNIVDTLTERVKNVNMWSGVDEDGRTYQYKGSDSRFSKTLFSMDGQTLTPELAEKLGLGSKKTKAELAKEFGKEMLGKSMGDWIELMDKFLKKRNTRWLDGLAPIKYAEDKAGINSAEDSGYVAARLASGSSSVMQAVMLYGVPEWKDGIIQKKEGTGEADSLLGVFESLGKDLNNWLAWMAGNRARELKAQGRENLLSDSEINALIALGEGKQAKFKAAKAKYNAMNKALLNLAEEAGLIDKESRESWESEWYVPFYRQDDEAKEKGLDAVIGPWKGRGIANQSAQIKRLKGSDKNVNDLLENIFINTGKLVDASMKNMAMQKVVYNLSDTDLIEVIPRPNLMQFKAADAVQVKIEGENYLVKIADPQLFNAMTQIDMERTNHWLMTTARGAKRLITSAVTVSPEFMLRNFLRDSLSSWAMNKDGFTPIVDSFKGVGKTLRKEGGTIDMMFAGSSFLGGYINGNDPQAMADSVRKALIRKGLSEREIRDYQNTIVTNKDQLNAKMRKGWDKLRKGYMELGEGLENANREAVYEAALKAGKSKAQAVFEAKDLMDFSMHGSSKIAMFMGDVLPFFNARLQGLGKLARATKENPVQIAQRGGMIAAASIALALVNGEDERYQELPDWDKDMNWHFWFGDEHVRIPKPFEIGVLFGTFPERIINTALFEDNMSDLASAFGRNLMSTFALNPVPQVINPLFEAAINYSQFTGEPIENMADLSLAPEARYNEKTSITMREIGELTGLSPKKLEHIYNGYLGTVGGYVLSVSDMVARSLGGYGVKPALRPEDLPVIKAFYQGSDRAKSTKYLDDFYKMMSEAEELYRTVNDFRKEGRFERANELLEERGQILNARKPLKDTQKLIKQLNNEVNLILRDGILTAEEKRERITRKLQQRNALVAQAVRRINPYFD
ncbi:LPD38 domain-containing protein [Vibrio cholerae]|uniref:LPD38 domain-containing protein n=1 Tax=Vibrio cholerae TaxID=666 RepID=UPI002DB98BF7|nr:LPD38 domain-containing protein [Vibrio cholerae]